MTPSHSPAPPHTLDAECAAAAIDLDTWVAARGSRRHSLVETSPRVHDVLVSVDPAAIERLLAVADTIRRHEFDLLGSGRFNPIDRSRAADAYTPIDWYLDPVAQCRFSNHLRQEEWTPDARPAGADIKRPWELGRCQHFVPLAQAFHLTRRGEYLNELSCQLRDFVDANPPNRGVNWACTMDVAIRAANWAIAFDLVRDASELPGEWWRLAYSALFDHGVFVEAHLENRYEVTSNHFLSDVVGLMFVATAFEDLPQGKRWLEMCREWLEREMQVQVLADGADYESSVPYHRLVAELFLSATRLGQRRSIAMSPAFMTRLRSMVQFVGDVLRPDGLLPQIGDNDDGRLHLLTNYGGPPLDGRHLFGAAAAVFGDPSWLAYGGRAARIEAAWWGFDAEHSSVHVPPSARLYPDAGLAVFRDADAYLLISNGIVGTSGFGNHKHNDQLGFEFHLRGVPIFVDPGTYVYTSDPGARNMFRGTAMHSTVRIDDTEQNDYNPEWLFRMFAGAPPEHVAFQTGPTFFEYRGRHHGYARLTEPVAHERLFRLQTDERSLQLTDTFTGRGTHRLNWHFHCAPGVDCEVRDRRVLMRAAGRVFCLDLPGRLTPQVVETWYSPSYGRRERCLGLDMSATERLPSEVRWEFHLREVTT